MKKTEIKEVEAEARKRKVPGDKVNSTVRNMVAKWGGGRKRRPVRSPSDRNVGAASRPLPTVCLVARAACYAVRRRHPLECPPDLVYKANVVSRDIPGKFRERRQWELGSMAEEGMFNMFMNTIPFRNAPGGDNSINWLIENFSNQGRLIRVEMTRNDTGEKIFETGATRPGNCLESAPPDARLPTGEHPCTAVFLAYQEESEALIGQVAVEIRLTIQE